MSLDRYGGQVKILILYVVIQVLNFALKTNPFFDTIGSEWAPVLGIQALRGQGVIR
jgi:hypothetical protein